MGLQNTHQNIMKTDLIRLMHGTLLHLFSLDKVKEFWETCPLDVCAAYGSFDTFFEKVWDRHAHLSIADAVIIGNAIEPFLIKNGSNLHEFALKAYLEVGHGTVRRKSTILRVQRQLFLRGSDNYS